MLKGIQTKTAIYDTVMKDVQLNKENIKISLNDQQTEQGTNTKQ